MGPSGKVRCYFYSYFLRISYSIISVAWMAHIFLASVFSFIFSEDQTCLTGLIDVMDNISLEFLEWIMWLGSLIFYAFHIGLQCSYFSSDVSSRIFVSGNFQIVIVASVGQLNGRLLVKLLC